MHSKSLKSHLMFNMSIFALLHSEMDSQFGIELVGVVANKTMFFGLYIAIDLHQLSIGTALTMESHHPCAMRAIGVAGAVTTSQGMVKHLSPLSQKKTWLIFLMEVFLWSFSLCSSS